MTDVYESRTKERAQVIENVYWVIILEMCGMSKG
jgi:hypothetical protein